MIPSVLLSAPVLTSLAYLGVVALLTWWIHRRIRAAEERSILVGKRVAGIRKNLGDIRDSYGDGTISTEELDRRLEELGAVVEGLGGELDRLANRVRILPAQMARAARGERYDKDEDEDESEGLGAAADGLTPDQVAEIIHQRANGGTAPAAPQAESLEARVFRLTHGGR